MVAMLGVGAGAWFLLRPKEPRRTFDVMMAAACGADEQTFMSYVDDAALADSMRDHTIKSINADASLAPLSKSLALSMAEGRKREYARDALDGWRSEIKKGEAGSICLAKVDEGGSALEDRGEVYTTTPSGKRKRWAFQRFGSKWMLVDMWDR